MKIEKAQDFFLVISIFMSSVCVEAAIKDNFPETSKEKIIEKTKRIQSIFEVTKSICFTRFVIDVPVKADVVFGRVTVNAEIERYEGMAHDIEGFMSRTISEHSDDALLFSKGGEIDRLAGAPFGSENSRLKHVISVTGYGKYSLDSFLVLGDDLYVFTGKGILGREVFKFIRHNEKTAMSLRVLGSQEIPEESGVCIDGAFSPQDPDYENIAFGVRLADFPDVHFSISLIKHGDFAESQEEFLNRHTEALQTAREAGLGSWIDRLKYLRRSQRKFADWTGDEILIQFPAWKDAKAGHQFAFWSTGKPNDPFHPQVDIRLDTGVKGNTTRSVQASLTDDEAVALWDRLLSSIRVRPFKTGKQKSSPYSSD